LGFIIASSSERARRWVGGRAPRRGPCCRPTGQAARAWRARALAGRPIRRERRRRDREHSAGCASRPLVLRELCERCETPSSTYNTNSAAKGAEPRW